MKKIYSTVAIVMAICLVTACTNQPTEDTVLITDSVTETSEMVTIGDSVETTTIDNLSLKLNEDVFNQDTLEILHTDFKPSEKLQNELLELINGYDKTCSLYMVNLEDNATFGYNSDTYIPTASTIKCPFAFYCYQEIEKGNHSFDETVLYQRSHYSQGTGVLKDGGSGTYYTVKDLLYYMIHYSDNVAFLMLQDYFGYEGYNEWLSSYGFETYLDGNIKWGKLSSHALGYVWTEIYKYKDTCEEGAILWDTLVNAGSNFLRWPFTEAGYEYQIAHKSGWAEIGYHDSGIVLSEHPFVIVVMTESSGETRDSSFFYNVVLKLNELHDEYLTYLGQEPSTTTTEETTTTTEETTTTTEETTTTTTEITTTTVETTTSQIIETTPTTTTIIEETKPIVTTVPVEQTQEVITYTITVYDTFQDNSQNTEQYQQYDDDNLYF